MLFEADFEPPQVQTRKALLALDLQNDFLSKDAKIAVDDAEHIVTRIAELTAAFRKEGDVVWVNTEFQGSRETVSSDTGSYVVVIPRFLPRFDGETDEEESAAPPPSTPASTTNANPSETDREAFLADFGDANFQRCCVPGSDGCEMPEALKKAIDPTRDLVITKSEYSAFAGGSLLMTLRTNLVTELFLCGSLSHISVYATAIDAIRYGFSLNIIEDCVSHGNILCHDEALRQMSDIMGAEMVASSDLITLSNEDPMHVPERMVDHHITVRKPIAKGSSESLTFRPRIENWVQDVIQDVPETPSAFADVVRVPSRKSSKSSKSSSPKLSKLESTDDLHLRRTISRSCPSAKRTAEEARATQQEKSSATDLSDLSSATSETSSGRVGGRPARRRRRTVTKEDGKAESTYDNTRAAEPTKLQTQNPDPDNPKTSSAARRSQPLSAPNSAPIQAREFPASLPEETYGEGDSYILRDLVPEFEVAGLFERLKKEVSWQKMYHRSGEVPRLVAVQGQVHNDGTIPIYRHPADESPPLSAFSPTVEKIREYVQKSVGVTYNHVLIQLYRSGEDNISEHSDKTLDIERDTNVVNLSLGVQRTMILRTKKTYQENPLHGRRDQANLPSTSKSTEKDPTFGESSSNARKIQRIPLPTNSLFVLGQATNRSWLHSIRADRRRPEEKCYEERAFGGERISLTFRRIATFINPRAGLIWGQGATSKIAESPARIQSDDADEVEKMIIAFGEENHLAKDFDWEKTYGKGFDVINFTTVNTAIALNDPAEGNISTNTASINAPQIPPQHKPQPQKSSSPSSTSKPPPSELVSIFHCSTDTITNLRIKLLLTETRTRFIVGAPIGPTRSEPEVLTCSRNADDVRREERSLDKLIGYEAIVSHFQPTTTSTDSQLSQFHSMDPQIQSIVHSWQKEKFSFDPSSETPSALHDIVILLRARHHASPPSPHPHTSPSSFTKISTFDRDLWCLLHDIGLRLRGGIQRFEAVDPMLKDFYLRIAGDELVKRALREDIRRVTMGRGF